MGFISALLLTNLVALVRPIGLSLAMCRMEIRET